MRRVLVGEARCRASQARYYLLEEVSEETGRSYGVEVHLNGETAAAANLSPCRRRVEALARALVRGTVTPLTLRDIVDDWLLE